MPRTTAKAPAKPPPLHAYQAKRDFARTPEPADTAAAQGARSSSGRALGYVIQKHHATRLHYDFRLELDGVLLSWAVPKGPSLDPAVKRMAVRTEDHPLAYAGFEGHIPKGQYGGGDVIIWDRGTWVPQGDAEAGLAAGKLVFELQGNKLAGRWELVRMKPRAAQKEAWLLFKKRDAAARAASDFDVLSAHDDSVSNTVAPAPAAAAEPAVPATLPATLAPQLAQPAAAMPAQGRWIYETKFDGYRLLTRIDAGVPRLLTRGGHDWTARLPALADALAALGVDTAWLDGEIVVTPEAGSEGGDFNALQKAFDSPRLPKHAAGGAPSTGAVGYRLFDLPYLAGHDLRGAPLYARRELLAQLLARTPHPLLRLSAELGRGGGDLANGLLRQACAAGWEGLVAKRADAPYRSTRSGDWLKLKCHQRQEFVIGGYTLRSDDAHAIGSLLLGVHDEAGLLRAAGNVGTGWSLTAARTLRQRLAALRRSASPFAGGAAPGRWGRRSAGGEHWVRPSLVAEVRFAAWTPSGHIRHAVFLALRADKPARAITRDEPLPTRADASPAMPSLVTLTHGERVVDAASGCTKRELLRYYDQVAEFIVPQLCGRPLALLRAPGGVGAATFFQKHRGRARIAGVQEVDAAAPGSAPLLVIGSRDGLLNAVQMNVVEFHTWNASEGQLAKPDRMVFDLDPGAGVGWPAIRDGAVLTHALLQELGLRAWLKTSGGKGLHLVVPLAARWEFATVKAFSKAIVDHLARTVPAHFVAKSGPANRPGRIFVDYLRNGAGATTVAAFSARARPGLGVSMPVAWDELAELKGADQFTVANALEYLRARRSDPWADLATTRQSLAAPMRALGFAAPPKRGDRA